MDETNTEMDSLRTTTLQQQALIFVILFLGGTVFGIAMSANLWFMGLLVLAFCAMILGGAILRLRGAIEEMYWLRQHDPHGRTY